jgi:predicted 3-demethylubiquinone-9 3-methyltransferase (glyoxalase superfamily)
MKKIIPCLWFDTQALEAAKFYTSVFPKSKLGEITYYSDAGPAPKGTVLTVRFKIEGQDFIALNGGPVYKFTPAISLSVTCKNQKEVDRLWSKLTEGGAEQPCAWLTDKYGVSWQIVPKTLQKLVASKNAAKVERVMKAMFTMTKIDIAAIERAAKGKDDAPKAKAKATPRRASSASSRRAPARKR